MKRAHVYISGRVQGVFYRASTRQQARQIGVSGWVRNLRDGRVEAVFEGTEDELKEILAWCHEGSSAARVSNVDVTWEDPQGISGFEVKRS